ncbi:hypothetical protein PSU4_12730 [Pseudonocardia sulfidoxydans NBRC 16205]|uniref:Uncharacterized protein n=1 Tax=Pseudonocardia sulfidoxydans NBRC 16205 TaxID=1223511 RepID=A0A511DBY5_9PSEU|nr:hypothetical protein PSU4_12730 [Pseudonocardia sulfidoxydans NBRC 16205]
MGGTPGDLSGRVTGCYNGGTPRRHTGRILGMDASPARSPVARLAGGPRELAFWVGELAHRADRPGVVALAVATIEPATRPLLTDLLAGAGPGPDVDALAALDPLRHRPYLDDGPDAAVVADVLLTGLSRSRADHVGARVWAAGHVDGPDDLAGLHRVVRGLLALDSIYGTPECRARLEARARYNLAVEERLLRDALHGAAAS